MNQESDHDFQKGSITSSLFFLKLALFFCLAIVFALVGNWWERSSAGSEEETQYFESVITDWKEKYGDSPELVVADISVSFQRSVKNFHETESVIITPVGIDLEGYQEVLEVSSFPPYLRKLEVDGITCLSWEYPGGFNRDVSVRALALVRRSSTGTVILPEAPTFEQVPESMKYEAVATAMDLEEHGLHKCAAFTDWVTENSGQGSLLDRYQRIISTLRTQLVPEDEKSPDDICKALRKKRFTLHRAHVLAVMTAREMGIPSFGCAAAAPGCEYIVTLFTDQTGWLFINLENDESDYSPQAPVLITRVPLVTSFEGASHDFWYPKGAVVEANNQWIYATSQTEWQRPDKDNPNVTRAVTNQLSETLFTTGDLSGGSE